MLGPDSQGKTRRSPTTSAIARGDPFPSGVQVNGGGSDHRAQTPPQDATEIAQICRGTSGSDRTRYDQERARRCRFSVGSDAADPRSSAAPNLIRRDGRDSETAHRGPGGTPRENPAAPTAL